MTSLRGSGSPVVPKLSLLLSFDDLFEISHSAFSSIPNAQARLGQTRSARDHVNYT